MRFFKALTIFIPLLLFMAGCSGDGKYQHPSGTLEATEVVISAQISAQISAVPPALGATVHPGDTLIVLDTSLILLQKEQTAAQRGSIEAQLLVAADGLMQARDNLALAKTTLERTKTLLLQGSATQQQVDELTTRRDVAKAALATAQHSIDGLKAEEARLDAALRVFDRQLEMGVILSPITGVVLLRNAEPGEVALPGQTLLKLGEIEDMELRIYLGETDLDLIRVGQEFPVLVDAFANDTLRGKITWISSDAEFTPKNAQTRKARTQLVYAVKLSLPNKDHKLAIGMPAEAILSTEK